MFPVPDRPVRVDERVVCRGSERPIEKATAVADAINRLLQNLVLRSAKAEGIQDYFHVGVIGYGKTIRAGFGGKLPFEVFVPISRLGENPLRMETRTKMNPDGRGGVTEQTVKFPVWFDPLADGLTPMNEAMAAAGLAVTGFIEKYREAYPPIDPGTPDRWDAER